MSLEIWKPIAALNGNLEVSNHGALRRGALSWIDKRGTERPIREPRIYETGGCEGARYHAVFGQGLCLYIHRLVVEAFIGPIPRGMDVCHADGNRQNNRLENLRIDTRSGNLADRSGKWGNRKKLSQEQVDMIRHQLAQGMTGLALAKLLDVSPTLISHIKNGKLWKDANPVHIRARPPLSPAQIKSARQLRSQGETFEAIAKVIGRSISSVRNHTIDVDRI
jgi:hypothetical protein